MFRFLGVVLLTLLACTGGLTLAAEPASAEARLLHIYQLIGEGKGREALPQADALVRDYPNFKLAHLVRGDLFLLLTQPTQGFAAVPEALLKNGKPVNWVAPHALPDTNGAKNLVLPAPKLDELKEEAQQRLRALRELPPQGSIPQAFVQLASITRHALLVDLSRSRLYHYTLSDKGALSLSASYYVTQGRNGAEKQKEGDERTPLGIYYITENINKKRLDSFYGVGALAINFPNEFDKRRSKSGSGIWLHGVPTGDYGTYSRVPKSSNGCVVLSNPDLLKLIKAVQPGETPIVIMSKATWLSPEDWQKQRAALQGSFEQWTRARADTNRNALANFYSAQFASYGLPFEKWFGSNYTAPVTGLPQHATLLYYPGPDEFMVATFYDAAIGPVKKGASKLTRKRQYWHKVNGKWQIFFEGALGV